MHWYLLHTKPRQEEIALLNLVQQGYECYLPTIKTEKIRRAKIFIEDLPLFPRYLFIHLDPHQGGLSWRPIQSTKGVNQLVRFGTEAAKIDDTLVTQIKQGSQGIAPLTLFTKGQRVVVTEGPFSGLEAIYQMNDGESRVMVLIQMLSKPTQLTIAPQHIASA